MRASTAQCKKMMNNPWRQDRQGSRSRSNGEQRGRSRERRAGSRRSRSGSQNPTRSTGSDELAGLVERARSAAQGRAAVQGDNYLLGMNQPSRRSYSRERQSNNYQTRFQRVEPTARRQRGAAPRYAQQNQRHQERRDISRSRSRSRERPRPRSRDRARPQQVRRAHDLGPCTCTCNSLSKRHPAPGSLRGLAS